MLFSILIASNGLLWLSEMYYWSDKVWNAKKRYLKRWLSVSMTQLLALF